MSNYSSAALTESMETYSGRELGWRTGWEYRLEVVVQRSCLAGRARLGSTVRHYWQGWAEFQTPKALKAAASCRPEGH